VRGIGLLLGLLLAASAASAQDTSAEDESSLAIGSVAQFSPGRDMTQALERRGDLRLHGTSLSAALFTINELWKVNIVAGQVEGEVNGVFKDAPLKEILDTILDSNGYGYRLVGESIVIVPTDQLGQMNPFFTSAAIPVTNVLPSTLVEAAGLLSTPRGQVKAVDSALSLIVVDFPERVQKIRALVASIDAASGGGAGSVDAMGKPKALEVAYYHTQYIRAVEAQKVLGTVLSGVGRAEAMEGEDRLVIVDYAENLQMARRVLEQIDRPRPQVRITALIYDLSLEDIEQIGINWSNSLNFSNDAAGDPLAAISANSILQQPFGANAVGSSFTFMNLSSNFDLTAVVLALQNASDSRLLADPNVTVMDNQLASFQAITQIPFQQITQTGNGGQLAGTAFKDAGIKLDVIPKIAADGTIALQVTPEFSRLTGFSPGDNQPIIDTRIASTHVRVANGETIVIGGMRQRSDVGDFAGVPGVKDVRFFGNLFRARNTNIRESELVVFITPHIVGYHPPLHCREQRVHETIDCRLGNVPVAEGRPQEACGCGSTEVLYGPEPYNVIPYESTPVDPARDKPTLSHPASLSPSVAPEPILPLPPATSYHPTKTPYRQLATLPRRLPPVAEPWVAEPRVAEPRVAIQPTAPSSRLRPDFDARFRATGGVYAGQQRLLERPLAAGGEEIKTADKPKSLWNRVFVR